MKILLLITVCNQNAERIKNVLDLLLKNDIFLKKNNITPVFSAGKPFNNICTSPYNLLKLDLDDKYTNLFLKIFYSFKEINRLYNFDYVWKIDDDTLINFNSFKTSLINEYDFTGNFIVNSGQENYLELTVHMKHEIINLVPIEFKNLTFACGSSYFLSKKAVNHIISEEQKVLLYKEMLENKKYIHIPEDQLFSFLLKDPIFIKNNIKDDNFLAKKYFLQCSKDYLSIHPVHQNFYKILSNKNIKEQLEFIEKNYSFFYGIRKICLNEMVENIKDTISNFLNAKRNLGLG